MKNVEQDDIVQNEPIDECESSMENVNQTNTNMSIDDFATNDDSIIPETQDVLSQDSISSLDHNQSDVEEKSGLEQSHSNLSVVSISSHDVTLSKATIDHINLNESQSETGVKLEASITPGK